MPDDLIHLDTVDNGPNRVNRGGSWNSNARNVRAANRNWNTPGNRNDNLGFRLARAQTWVGWPTPDPTAVPSRAHGLAVRAGEYEGRRCASRLGAERSPAPDLGRA